MQDKELSNKRLKEMANGFFQAIASVVRRLRTYPNSPFKHIQIIPKLITLQERTMKFLKKLIRIPLRWISPETEVPILIGNSGEKMDRRFWNSSTVDWLL